MAGDDVAMRLSILLCADKAERVYGRWLKNNSRISPADSCIPL